MPPDQSSLKVINHRCWTSLVGQSGFRACGICPLDPNEPLSQLPSLDVSESNSLLNETLIDLLKKNRGFDSEKQKQTCGKKISKPGEVLSSTMFEEHAMQSSLEIKRKKKNGNTNSMKEGNSDDTWKCKSCKEIWHGQDDDGNRWIVCDACDGKYHLQCSGIYYEEEQYYEIEIENELFLCEECE